MSSSVTSQSASRLFRPVASRLVGNDLALVFLVLLLHLVLRFSGVRDVRFIALSMAIVWPLPWLLMHRDGRHGIGFRAPRASRWLLLGPVIGLLTVVTTVALVWLALGSSSDNWFVQYGRTVSDVVARFPPGTSPWLPFLAVAVPAMTLSPIAEEFLFRGLVFSGIRSRWGDRTAAVVQATAFALAHLANYGLVPFQPLLDLFWLPSMFVAATAFQYVAVRSRSLWPPILAHCAYNLGMTTMAFVLLG